MHDPRQRRLFSQKDLKDLFTLNEDTGAIGKGGEGITDTGRRLGDGVVQREQIEFQQQKNSNSDNNQTLKSVLSSRGLAGIWDHDSIETSKDVDTVDELERHAYRVAEKAAGKNSLLIR